MSDNSVIIGLTGDVMIGRTVDTVIGSKGYLYPWGNVLSLFKNTDVNIINLEAALTYSNKKVSKTFNFKAAPDRINTLKEASITLVNLANNHILDFSDKGLRETLQVLDAAGIKYVGAGLNDKHAAHPCILHKKNTIIGVLGFTDNEPGWKATAVSSGINYIEIEKNEDRQRAVSDIVQLHKLVDIVIVSIHWGPNMKEAPDDYFIDFAHEMIDAGADIIHGHSAHNFQGIENYHGKLILYDTGDFLDDYMVDTYLKNDHSFFYRVEAEKNGRLALELYPVLISNYQVNLAVGDDYQWCFQRIQQLSAKFGTTLTDKGKTIILNIA
jgi:poly-gamma-glutamate synthesis protein (capsule biosynthesis protein)